MPTHRGARAGWMHLLLFVHSQSGSQLSFIHSIHQANTCMYLSWFYAERKHSCSSDGFTQSEHRKLWSPRPKGAFTSFFCACVFPTDSLTVHYIRAAAYVAWWFLSPCHERNAADQELEWVLCSAYGSSWSCKCSGLSQDRPQYLDVTEVWKFSRQERFLDRVDI